MMTDCSFLKLYPKELLKLRVKKCLFFCNLHIGSIFIVSLELYKSLKLEQYKKSGLIALFFTFLML